MAWLLLLQLASAHPGGHGSGGSADPMGGLPGQRTEARIDGGQLWLDYYVEIPAIRLYKEAKAEGAQDREWAARKVESLRPGLRARWNDAELTLLPTPVAVPAQAREGNVVELHLAAQAALPPLPGTLELRMDNFPGEPCYLATSLRLDGGLVARRSDLGEVRDGRLRDNVHDAWRTAAEARKVRVELRATHPWERHEAGPLPARMEGLVGPEPAVVAGAIGVGVAGAVALAVWGWRRRARAARG